MLTENGCAMFTVHRTHKRLERASARIYPLQKSIHGLVGTPLPDNLAPKFTTAMHDLEERFSTAIIKNAAMQASRTQSRSPFQQSAAGGFGSTARSREQAGQPRQRARFQPPSSGAAGPR